ncbi:MAG: hypothetical protein A3D93_01225 [Acidobacteria bacterium RIFCSPHIGHO2_12_FULL_67_30]|nr:MAG: hypothetical protein A2620_06280 [Acidobacteria bacterium RIFCSPHIGHO2_01_FULL_67_28]OFV87922.1 MAG: hypothetical protein A3D93_01225 [Acidobacteria bacterium RIFCSPHIGHO2_12_FULL_67_30]
MSGKQSFVPGFMKKVFIAVFFVCVPPCFGQTGPETTLSREKIGNVLSCLQAKLGPIGHGPPRARPHSFAVRYFYGILTPGEEQSNELQLVVYGPKEASATLYRVYFNEKDDKKVIFIGEWGTLKKEDGQMVPDEIPGGVGTYYQIKKLLGVVSRNPALTIPDRYVKPGTDACVYEP